MPKFDRQIKARLRSAFTPQPGTLSAVLRPGNDAARRRAPGPGIASTAVVIEAHWREMGLHAAPLPRDEDAAWLGSVAAAASLIGMGALDPAAGKLLRFLDDDSQRMPIVWVAGERLGMQDQLPAGRAGVGGDDRHFNAELVRGLRLAFADALDLGRVQPLA